jgi:DNA-binding Xre family transcriptional regulator
LGISQNAVGALLRGASTPSLETVGKLCEVLGCMPNDILTFEPKARAGASVPA